MNILSSINLIKNSYKFGRKKFILHVIAAYGKIKKKVKETDVLNPVSSYAISKLTIENYLRYMSNFKLKLKVCYTRYFNVTIQNN